MSGELPSGWRWVQLGTIAETQLGKMLSGKSRQGLQPHLYLRNRNVQWHSFDLSDVAQMDFSESELRKYELRPGDLLVCEGGEVGRCAVWSRPAGDMCFQKALHRVRPLAGVQIKWIEYFLRWSAETGRFGNSTQGSTIAHLPQRDLRMLQVPVAPSAEQKRIVGAIEEHFSRLDAVEGVLSAAAGKVGALRRRVLSEAFAGRLVPQDPDDERASVLLKRISRSGEGDGRMTEDHPLSWIKTSVREVANLIRGVTFRKPESSQVDADDLVPIIRAGNVSGGGLRLDEDLVFVPKERVAEEQLLRRGDIVIATSSGSASVIGKSALVRESWGGAHGAFMVALRPNGNVDSAFLAYCLQEESVRNLWREAAAGTNINNLKRDDLLSTEIPLCPISEQRRIAVAIEEHFSRLDAVEGVLSAAAGKVGALRRRVLSEAFAGRLVPQDPDDEPVSALLDRIAVSQQATGADIR